MAGLTAIKRKGFRGGGMDASTTSFSESFDKQMGNAPGTTKGNPEMDRREREGQAAADKTNQEIANRAAIRERQKVLDEILVTPAGRNKRLNKFQIYNNKFQRQRNLELARKRAFQKYQDIEQYADIMDDYSLTAEELAAEIASNPNYGYDFSNLDKGLATLTSNRGTSIESTRPNLYDVQPKAKYSITQAILDKFRPDTQVTALNTLNKARDYTNLVNNSSTMTNQEIKDALTDLQNRGKTPDQIDPPDDNSRLPYIPMNYTSGVTLPIDDVAEEKTFDYRFGTGQKIGADVLRGYVANGGRITRAGGGIMNAVPRQGYFLGKIVKGVGKAIGSVADAAGKVLKSDVGKMAIAGLGAYYMGGGMNLGGARMFGNTGFGTSGFMSNLGRVGTFIKENPFKSIGLASVALPFLAGEAKPNEDIGMTKRGGSLIDPITGQAAKPAEMRASLNEALNSADGDPDKIAAIQKAYAFLGPDERLGTYLPYRTYGVKDGGRIRAQEGGLMNLGGMEKDYRNEGGFVPIGKAEKADDVPARLSVNEFVFTADAVRNAGGGDIDKGAEVMENMMKNLENGGRVSEESQGNTGAQEMFSVSERIGEVI